MALLGIDVGGTFTDAVLLENGRVATAKVPTAARQEESVLAAAGGVGAANVERFTHGTTIATNALLERKGARTAFVATEGFEHLLLRVERYALRTGSSGAGAHRGGDGIVRSVRALEDCRCSLLTERRARAPQGAAGGAPGLPGRNFRNGEELPAKVTLALVAGDVITVETPGGGGFGAAAKEGEGR